MFNEGREGNIKSPDNMGMGLEASLAKVPKQAVGAVINVYKSIERMVERGI